MPKKNHTIMRSKKAEKLLTTFFVKTPYFIKTSTDSTDNIMLCLPQAEYEGLGRLEKFFCLWLANSGIILDTFGGNKIFLNALVTFPNENCAKQFLYNLITLQKLHLSDDKIKLSFFDLTVPINTDSSLDRSCLFLGSEKDEHNGKESNSLKSVTNLYGSFRNRIDSYAPTEATIITSLTRSYSMRET